MSENTLENIIFGLKEEIKGLKERGEKIINELHKTIDTQKAEIERLTEENGQLKGYNSGLEYENAELQKKIENQKAVIKGQADRIEKEKAENQRLYDEFVRLDDFCATKGCICCVCENKKTCKECSKCESLKTEKCNKFKIDVSKYTRAIERADKLQKQINEFQEKIKHGTLIDTTKYFLRTEEYKPFQTRYLICKYGVHTDVYNFYTDKEKAERDLEMIYNV